MPTVYAAISVCQAHPNDCIKIHRVVTSVAIRLDGTGDYSYRSLDGIELRAFSAGYIRKIHQWLLPTQRAVTATVIKDWPLQHLMHHDGAPIPSARRVHRQTVPV